MSTTPCPVERCDRPRPGNVQVCGACAAELRRALEAVPDLARELETTLTRQTSMGGGGRGSESPLPYDPRATFAADVLRSALVGWVRMIQTEMPPAWHGPACAICTHPSCRIARGAAYVAWLAADCGNTLAEMGEWLLERIRELLRHAVAEEAVGEITAAVRQAERVVDRPGQRWYAGPCDCGTGLYAQPDTRIVTCPDCGAQRSVEKSRELLREAIQDLLMTATQAAHALTSLDVPTSANSICKWAERKRLAAHGTDERGRPLYRVSEVQALQIEAIARAAERDAKKGRERMAL